MKMKEEHNKWKMIDQALTPDEQAALEAELQQDPEAMQQLKEAQLLHKHLQQMETEEPSMRFTQNIMDRLPKLYRPIQIRPLFTKRQLRWASGGLIFLVVLSLLPAFTLEGGQVLPYQDYIRMLSEAGRTIPSNWFLIMIALSLGIVAAILLDRGLKKRFLNKKS